ncbi:uncharacterized protein J3D65DRAFT_222853 [Phyllosticta citribraziliensis]|uniref:Secreted protein n=1 Tax=Phyllosticta citribraziliensis TaxID=989973 RepID=A0ABR1M4W5_9PEZI
MHISRFILVCFFYSVQATLPFSPLFRLLALLLVAVATHNMQVSFVCRAKSYRSTDLTLLERGWGMHRSRAKLVGS